MKNKHERMTFAFVALLMSMFILLLLFINVASANDDPRIAKLKAYETQLYEFIAEHSNYQVEGLPEVTYVFMPRAILNAIYYGDAYDPNHDNTVVALYKASVIMLRDDYDLELMSHVQVHELMHHVQMFNNATFECVAEQEREAYEISNLYTKQTNVGQEADALFMMFLSCHPGING